MCMANLSTLTDTDTHGNVMLCYSSQVLLALPTLHDQASRFSAEGVIVGKPCYETYAWHPEWDLVRSVHIL